MRILVGILIAVLLMVPQLSAAQAPTTSGTPQLPRVYVDVNLLGFRALDFLLGIGGFLRHHHR